MARPRALIIDDEADIRELLGMTLEGMDITPVAASTLEEARKALADNNDFRLCLTDMRLPDGDGMDFVGWMQREHPQIPVAMITAHGNVELAVQALKSGAFDFVTKPLELGKLRGLISHALDLEAVAAKTATPVQALTGNSPRIRELHTMIGKVARSEAPVMISGESGTGKELVARMIHEHGPRSSGPFVPVNCGAIPPELMESELFGHHKGSFTGATSDREGLFHAAADGTLFLDEVAELPPETQVKLLRVIQERAVRPVGGREEIPVDVRILSATHKDLGAEVAAGRFREDIYYRLNVIELTVPALRERMEDLPDLAEQIVRRLATGMRIDPPRLDRAAVDALRAHPFPGNVRELENILERAMTLSGGPAITAEDIRIKPPPGNGGEGIDDMPPDNGEPLPEFLETMERRAIARALERTRHNKTEAAKLLGMTFRQLRYRISKLGLG